MASDEGSTFVGVRLDAAAVRRLDELAAAESLTRSAVIQRLCDREVGAVRIVAPLSFLRANFLGKLPLVPLDDGGDPVLELVLRRDTGLFKRDAKFKPAKLGRSKP